LLDKSIFCVVSADVCCWFDGTGVGRVPVFSLDELLNTHNSLQHGGTTDATLVQNNFQPSTMTIQGKPDTFLDEMFAVGLMVQV
jgi:hypothetical protein